jgi:hypothetical protein
MLYFQMAIREKQTGDEYDSEEYTLYDVDELECSSVSSYDPVGAES